MWVIVMWVVEFHLSNTRTWALIIDVEVVRSLGEASVEIDDKLRLKNYFRLEKEVAARQQQRVKQHLDAAPVGTRLVCSLGGDRSTGRSAQDGRIGRARYRAGHLHRLARQVF